MSPLTSIPAQLPAIAVDIVIFTLIQEELKVLLLQRMHPPFQGYWALPGGFVGVDESLEEAARRVLREKGKVDDIYLEQLYTFGDPARDPRARIVTVAYFALVGEDKLDKRGRAAGRVAWHSAYDPPPLGFDHQQIVRYAIQRLRYKLEYSAVAFQLLPDTFTLTDLQNAYEHILREKLDKRNFRRKVLSTGILEETGDLRIGDHRPAKLYRFSDDATLEGQARRLFP
ncbi:MAG: NUDIX hydrolase [Chloroflexota bacterium]|nr:NUDIX hydrolase [Chloroflexota bacterium]